MLALSNRTKDRIRYRTPRLRRVAAMSSGAAGLNLVNDFLGDSIAMVTDGGSRYPSTFQRASGAYA